MSERLFVKKRNSVRIVMFNPSRGTPDAAGYLARAKAQAGTESEFWQTIDARIAALGSDSEDEIEAILKQVEIADSNKISAYKLAIDQRLQTVSQQLARTATDQTNTRQSAINKLISLGLTEDEARALSSG